MAPTGIGPTGFIPSAEGEFESRDPRRAAAPGRSGRCSGAGSCATGSRCFSIFVLLVPGDRLLRRRLLRAVHEHGPGPAARLRSSPNGTHWLGTDELGRDQLSRLLYAGQISLKIGFAVAIISTVVGTAVGAVAGYFGKGTDQAADAHHRPVPRRARASRSWRSRCRSAASTETRSSWCSSVLFWMYVARVVRGQVLSLKEKEFVEAARASGASPTRIIVRHIVPNIIGSIMVNTTLGVAGAIIAESTLSFLGFGVQPPQTSWGSMLSDAEGYVGTVEGVPDLRARAS